MKKILLLSLMLVMVSGSSAWATVTTNSSFITVGNDSGTRYDYDAANAYNLNFLGKGGTNALHITNDASNAIGQVSTSNSTSGVFYVMDTGGRGYNDDIILLLSVAGTVSDNFSVNIKSSGYNWTPATNKLLSGINPSTVNYAANRIDESFAKADFIYGPQSYKPGPGGGIPLSFGDTGTSSYMMYIDLYAGTLKEDFATSGGFFADLIDNGAVKVEYSFTGLTSNAIFSAYGWTLTSNQGQGIHWTNDTQVGSLEPSGLTVAASAPVPIPPSVLLFASGLGGLAVFRRKRTAC